MSDLSHFGKDGKAVMVDVSAKNDTHRTAIAKGSITMKPETLDIISTGSAEKGDVLGAARIAAIMATKKTADLIPLCHPLPIAKATIEFGLDKKTSSVHITATVKVSGKTGVEMEALTAVSVAGLTIYDMVKAVDKSMVIGDIRLVHKEGGKSGTFTRDEDNNSTPKKGQATLAKPSEVPMSSAPLTHGRSNRREALRSFMEFKRIKPLRWAQDAGVETGRLYGFLQGQISRLSEEEDQKLAAAINVAVDTLYKETRS